MIKDNVEKVAEISDVTPDEDDIISKENQSESSEFVEKLPLNTHFQRLLIFFGIISLIFGATAAPFLLNETTRDIILATASGDKDKTRDLLFSVGEACLEVGYFADTLKEDDNLKFIFPTIELMVDLLRKDTNDCEQLAAKYLGDIQPASLSEGSTFNNTYYESISRVPQVPESDYHFSSVEVEVIESGSYPITIVTLPEISPEAFMSIGMLENRVLVTITPLESTRAVAYHGRPIGALPAGEEAIGIFRVNAGMGEASSFSQMFGPNRVNGSNDEFFDGAVLNAGSERFFLTIDGVGQMSILSTKTHGEDIQNSYSALRLMYSLSLDDLKQRSSFLTSFLRNGVAEGYFSLQNDLKTSEDLNARHLPLYILGSNEQGDIFMISIPRFLPIQEEAFIYVLNLLKNQGITTIFGPDPDYGDGNTFSPLDLAVDRFSDPAGIPQLGFGDSTRTEILAGNPFYPSTLNQDFVHFDTSSGVFFLNE